MNEWVELTLRLQQDVGSELSRLTVATVVAEVRRDLRMAGEAETLSAVDLIAGERLAELLERRHDAGIR